MYTDGIVVLFIAMPLILQDAGPLVRFKGCQVSLLLGGTARSQEVPQSAGMQAHLAAGNLQQALEVSQHHYWLKLTHTSIC